MMCTEWATHVAIIMIGTPELAGLNTVPSQPATPMVFMTMNTNAMMMDKAPSSRAQEEYGGG